jgi:hypothetical protein
MGTAVQNVEKDFWVCWTFDDVAATVREFEACINVLPGASP